MVPSSEKAPLIEDQEELRAIRTETLNRMREAGGKDPEVSFADVVDKHCPIGIHYGDACIAIEHVRPFVGRMPVHLTVASRSQAHIDARDVP
jgi:hypothetical protein